MEPDRIVQLTEQQRLCLRLVYAHLTSKEIAAHLGMEPASIDQDVKSAVRVLGARDRRDAAQILAEYEERVAPRPTAHQPPGAAAGPGADMFGLSAGGKWRRGRRASREGFDEEEDAFGAGPSARRFRLTLPIGGVEPERLGWQARLAWIAAIAIGIAIAFSVLVSTLEVLTRLVG